jgi:CheY-like chemotaxis protein
MDAQRAAAGDAGLEVLVARESPTQAERMRFALEGRGCRVRVARTGGRAIDLVRSRPPAVLVADVAIPGLDGYALCRALKGDPSTRGIHVVLLVTLSGPGDLVRSLECGADDFLCKPVDEPALLERLERFLGRGEGRGAEERDEGLEIVLRGERVLVPARRLPMLNLLLAAFDAAARGDRNPGAARPGYGPEGAPVPDDPLRICAKCKKIQDDRGEWVPVEEYLRARANLSFTHEFCQGCTGDLGGKKGRL